MFDSPNWAMPALLNPSAECWRAVELPTWTMAAFRVWPICVLVAVLVVPCLNDACIVVGTLLCVGGNVGSAELYNSTAEVAAVTGFPAR